ncbi:MAG TPA: thermonuclease family protein [Ramlibacter sp.]|jgi:endonuclease YncB( thermonuclease family)|nr:thermonuclease family protein [Ramlibacter sp.]
MRTLLLALVCFAPLGCSAGQLRGTVSHVTDGDTVWVRPDDGTPAQQVRIEGIDAPEICQVFGRQSRDALAQQLLRKRVTLLTRGQDDYRRTVARVHVGRADVGKWMVSHGYAWSYKFRSDSGPYRRDELHARSQRLGLWDEGDPERPRDFRVRHGSCH